MKKKFFIIFFFIFLACILPNKSDAYSSDPKQFIQEIVDEVKQVLVDTNSKSKVDTQNDSDWEEIDTN